MDEAEIAKGEALLADYRDLKPSAGFRFYAWVEVHARTLLQSAREAQRLREALRRINALATMRDGLTYPHKIAAIADITEPLSPR